MTEEIIKAIAEAENQATAMKSVATENAAQTVRQAEKRAAEIEKTSSEVCKAYRETMQKNAEETATKSYNQALDQARLEAKEYCRKILSGADATVGKIVGRMTSGDC
jgi:vacuolar-type H+-ATPase subunit H